MSISKASSLEIVLNSGFEDRLKRCSSSKEVTALSKGNGDDCILSSLVGPFQSLNQNGVQSLGSMNAAPPTGCASCESCQSLGSISSSPESYLDKQFAARNLKHSGSSNTGDKQQDASTALQINNNTLSLDDSSFWSWCKSGQLETTPSLTLSPDSIDYHNTINTILSNDGLTTYPCNQSSSSQPSAFSEQCNFLLDFGDDAIISSDLSTYRPEPEIESPTLSPSTNESVSSPDKMEFPFDMAGDIRGDQTIESNLFAHLNGLDLSTVSADLQAAMLSASCFGVGMDVDNEMDDDESNSSSCNSNFQEVEIEIPDSGTEKKKRRRKQKDSVDARRPRKYFCPFSDGERPYACPIAGCTKRFSRTDNLSQHLKIHAKGSRRARTLSNFVIPNLNASLESTNFSNNLQVNSNLLSQMAVQNLLGVNMGFGLPFGGMNMGLNMGQMNQVMGLPTIPWFGATGLEGLQSMDLLQAAGNGFNSTQSKNSSNIVDGGVTDKGTVAEGLEEGVKNT